MIQKYMRQNLILLIIIIAMIMIGTCIVIFYNAKIFLITKQSEDLVEYNKQMGELFITWQEQLYKQNQLHERRDSFMIYTSDIIIKHYINHKSVVYKQMTSNEIIILLDTIYSCSLSYGIDPFLPLAFAVVETDLYNDAIGADGERSIYQFMPETAREMYRELNIPFNENYWRDPCESTKLWFAYYKKLSMNFSSENEERTIKWTALSYNAGLYRNSLRYYFNNDYDIEMYLRNFPIRKGINTYYKDIYNKYVEFKSGFELK